MRRALSSARRDCLHALRCAVAGSHGTEALLDELARIDAAIQREHEREIAFAELREANSREDFKSAIDKIRSALRGGA